MGDSRILKQNYVNWAGEMAHLVKCLSCKHEDMKWIPRLLLKIYTRMHACAWQETRYGSMNLLPHCWKGRDWRRQSGWIGERKRLEEAVWMNRGTPGHWETPAQRTRWMVSKEWPWVCPCPYKCTCAYLCMGNPTTTECTFTYMNKTAMRT